MTDSKTLKVLLVEDDPAWQQAIEGLLMLEKEYVLVEKVDTYEKALLAYQQHNPDVVLLDWKINQEDPSTEKDGLMVGEALNTKFSHPPHQIVLISGSSPDEIPENEFLYVPKSRISTDLPATLRGIGEVLSAG